VTGGAGLALVQMSLVEQWYPALLAVRAGDGLSEVAARIGVSRQTVRPDAIAVWKGGRPSDSAAGSAHFGPQHALVRFRFESLIMLSQRNRSFSLHRLES
jgi:hypothetical protein